MPGTIMPTINEKDICFRIAISQLAYKIPVEQIKKRSRGGLAPEARKLFIYASHKIFGLPVIDIA